MATNSLVVSRIDAGVALLCDIESAQVLEFPSSLIPLGAGIGVGSILNVVCSRDHEAERARDDAFWRMARLSALIRR